MPHVLLMSVAGSLVRKAKLSVILRFAFIMAFLLSLNVCPRSRNEQADYLKRGLHRFYWRYLFFVIVSGWLTLILLPLFVIASGWFTHILLTLFVLASGWLTQCHLVSFSFISFTCSTSGWTVCSQWVVYVFSFAVLFSRSSPLGLGSTWVEASRIQWLCVFSCWVKICSHQYLIFVGYIFGRTGFVFHLNLAVQAFGSFLFVFDFLLRVCVFFLLLFCRCFQLYHVVGSSGCGSPGIWCFTVCCKFSS